MSYDGGKEDFMWLNNKTNSLLILSNFIKYNKFPFLNFDLV